MPLYDYRCEACGDFTALRSLAQWRDPAPCPDCGQSCSRFLSGAPAVSALSSTANRAHAVNERASHEPRRSGHGMACACCKGGSKTGGRTQADGTKSFLGARPWMISH
ncbi:zinc ribbon domain-containing protein [Bordetella avium]|uniref:Putative regulatory protein FmdB zinc ribbon domain-containing protein n=1 Tax=Bordetella avium (strain 197N) TaxID=360910 RepID=Q2KYM5_BORA1|nr:zinc ribbon domain-containing protein [Bordetella avium]AZY49559.1 zinc ribbon domain-containing protein [Bordetella avium]AZY52955.1 zinc ribbon domain-containing protein [Bordetella avium]RIQ11952.1 zinc ribbon domain-containing protein [Bordetella avium]RIQ17741.1 zinc ribbon domain-containing protein [Bordetella avium]RIQ32397.1 zinc ribbon domain-containing protein [Bordetella avium]